MFNNYKASQARKNSRKNGSVRKVLAMEACGCCFYCERGLICHDPVLREKLSRRTGQNVEEMENSMLSDIQDVYFG